MHLGKKMDNKTEKCVMCGETKLCAFIRDPLMEDLIGWRWTKDEWWCVGCYDDRCTQMDEGTL